MCGGEKALSLRKKCGADNRSLLTVNEQWQLLFFFFSISLPPSVPFGEQLVFRVSREPGSLYDFKTPI